MKTVTPFLILSLGFGLALAAGAAEAERDVLIADFEGKDYGDWKATGTAFGPGPAQGTVPGQMPVSGFEGKGLVNSFYDGDKSTGTLTSPPFKIERKFINFLIGGGYDPARTCINLLVDGKAVRNATGPNRQPGGTERLDPYSWDVAELLGKEATIEIVDKATGGWGHINIDHIVQSNRRSGTAPTLKDLRIDRPYLTFCFAPKMGPRNSVTLLLEGKRLHSAAGSAREKLQWITWDVSQLKGKTAQVKTEEIPAPDGATPLADSVALSDEPKGVLIVTDKLYEETWRPQFHFTPAKNWTNDPNGCVFYKGEYHLFFQHNPTGINWGNMTWGHAVSPDLVHWTQLDHAIHPDKLGTIFSGSAVVDWNNTAGFQAGDEKVLVCIYTSAGTPFTQSIAYSNDRGRTFTKYEKNPVLKHIVGGNRDPKVIWHEPSKQWVMALYLDKSDYALFGSPNLKEWTKLCDVPMPGSTECPDLFELPVDGKPDAKKWVFWGGNSHYLLGTFDGKTFAKEAGPLPSEWGANNYAAQTWSDIPPSDGRRLQIAWMSGGKYPDMPFNQQMCFPRELTLRTTPDGIRLYRVPAREIQKIHAKKHAWSDLVLKPGDNPLSGITGDLFDIRAEFELDTATAFGFDVRGTPVRYSVAANKLSCLGREAPLAWEGEAPAEPSRRIRLQILVDRTSIELFGNDGRVSLSSCFLPDLENKSLSTFAEGGAVKLRSLEVYELNSIWPKANP